MRHSLVIPIGALAVLGVASLASAQIEPGRIYAGGEQLSDPELGLRLTIPAGWRGGLSPDGESLQLRSDAGGSFMVVLADEMTEADARARMAEPVDLGDGVVLTPRAEVRTIASGHLSAPYSVSGTQVELASVVDVRLTPAGLGVAFILLAPPGAIEAEQEALRELALSLGVKEPAVQAGGNDEWQPYLRGKYLARFYTATGYTESTELWLCSDGSFQYDSQGGGFGGGASGAAQSTGGGRWSATGAGKTGTLVLQWGNGERSTLSLEYDYEANRLYVNGERMLGGPNEVCR
jgi:hypothetical protein